MNYTYIDKIVDKIEIEMLRAIDYRITLIYTFYKNYFQPKYLLLMFMKLQK